MLDKQINAYIIVPDNSETIRSKLSFLSNLK